MEKQQTIKQKKFRFAFFTVITTILAVAIAVFAVKLAYQIPWRYDMTAQRIFTLSGQSENVLSGLTEDVKIAAVYSKGSEEMMVQSLLAEYEKASEHITVEYIDAEREPAKLAAYRLDLAAIPNGTLIVRGTGYYKLIPNTTLFEDTVEGSAFNGEREITGAIRYVTTTNMPKVYLVQGHMEANPDTQLSQAISTLQLDAYEVASLNLLQQGGVPEDADILIVASPKEDITEPELEMLRAYLKTGGGLFLAVDPVMNSNSIQLPNLNVLCNDFGVDITNNYVVEESPDHYLSVSPLYLIPDIGPHEITTPIAEQRKMVILPVARGLGYTEYDKETVLAAPILASSDKSWIRTDMTVTSDSRTEKDISGPISIAYAATVSNVRWGNDASRIVIIGNSSFAYDGNIEAQANRTFFANTVGWLEGGRQSELIASKVINADRLVIRGTDFVRLAIICVAVLPLIATIGALLVWFLRRNQ